MSFMNYIESMEFGDIIIKMPLVMDNKFFILSLSLVFIIAFFCSMFLNIVSMFYISKVLLNGVR